MPVTDDYIVAPAPAMKTSVRVRSVYDRAFTRSPVGAQIIRSLLADGQEARVLAELPMKMQLADENCVLLPLTPTGTGGAMLVHARPVVSALRQYFELLWERAVPYGCDTTAPGLTGRQREILSLLAQGLTDDAIANQLGCSAKTVGREAALITARLGAASRFAAGAAAQRRGWLT
jgi:DNA-binding CsgD family transcriptional regulator